MSPSLMATCEIHRELAGRNVEASECAQEVVHRGQVGVLDRDLQVECGSLLAREKITRDAGIAAAHELAAKRQIRGPLSLMIGQILDRQVGVVDEQLIVRVAGFVGVREIAVGDVEVAHSDIHRRAVVLLLNLLAGRFYPLRFRLLGLLANERSRRQPRRWWRCPPRPWLSWASIRAGRCSTAVLRSPRY